MEYHVLPKIVRRSSRVLSVLNEGQKCEQLKHYTYIYVYGVVVLQVCAVYCMLSGKF